MKYFSILTICGLLLIPLTGVKAAADPYAESIVENTGNILNVSNAIGGPDEVYADFMDKDTYIKFDLGEDSMGIGDLQIHYYLLYYGADIWVEFYNEADEKVDFWGTIIPLEGDLIAEYEGEVPYRYVKITSTDEETWRLDAIEVLELYVEEEEVVEEETEVEEESVEEETEEALETIEPGTLIKLEDDGDSETQYDSAVYVLSADGKRHAFPNETVFFSWFENFDEVFEISQAEMETYPLGANVTMRAGTHLVTFPTTHSVYAVEPGGVLREIETEEIAAELYTENWTMLLVDVADVFWGNYEIGEPIATAIHPTGTVLQSPYGEVLYYSNGNHYSMSGAMKNTYRFQNDFFIPVEEELFSLYVDGGYLEEDLSLIYPY